ncbi:MAG: hypothetical protein HQ518_31350 [Rhodopirellula sp.]|nr:hypothetical protein [Rhodopirellula sp.]
MNRSRISLNDIADWENLTLAAHRAGQGKRNRPEVREFFQELDGNLGRLRQGILSNTIEVGMSTVFQIRDPKPRTIHAPCFFERVLHHALMNHVSPVLDRSMIADTFACRTGKGSLAAVQRCRQHVRRFEWYSKQDVRQYFASIDHGVLLEMLGRRFRSRGVFGLLRRIIESHEDSPGCGLPIGALTSQHLANFYLGRLDRFLLEGLRVRAMVRYMDDFAFWCDSRNETRDATASVREFAKASLKLTLREPGEINRSSHGITLCGYRIYAGTIRLATSRRRRFSQTQAKWERLWLEGRLTPQQLQCGYSAALAITLHADSVEWRRRLAANPPAWYEDV